MSKLDARAALVMLKSGLVAPLNGAGTFATLEADTGRSLLDRLITDDYRRADLITLTLDRKMAALPKVRQAPSRLVKNSLSLEGRGLGRG